MDNLSSSSPVRQPSSPVICATLAITPPTSPATSSDSPIFKQQAPAPTSKRAATVHNAFTVLGKRKQPLSEVDGNIKPAKRRAVQAVAKKDAAPMTQMQLSLGQKVETRCQGCGMLYVASMHEDRKLHDKFHRSASEGVEVSAVLANRQENLVSHVSEALVCVVRRQDAAWKRNYVRKVLDVMTSCLGAVEITDERLWGQKRSTQSGAQHEMWMYIKDERCVAALLTRRHIVAARRVLNPLVSSGAGKESALEKLKRRRAELAAAIDAPLQVSEITSRAKVGISRMWTAPSSRGGGLATTLLDTMFQSIMAEEPSATVLAKVDTVAFSQPTSAGTRLARKWFGRPYGWLVYSDE